ncbi:hypothetical protein DE146DRAFT_750664 [Phaeosphaeria sp. MPI-PUGE-AT-0046c]|nr:hypothetical protein DE146DRAFT_750664 [Phaeosphaeria sp. MPI-PUGE-AT-0046c]
MSAADGEAPPPPSKRPTADIPMDDFSFETVFESVEDHSPIMGPQLPIEQTGPMTTYQPEHHSYGSDAWSSTPPRSFYSSSTSHKEPNLPLPQPVSDVHVSMEAMRLAVLTLAPLMQYDLPDKPGYLFTVITARSADGTQVTAFLALVEAKTRHYRVMRGGVEYFRTYRDAMMHLLAPMEKQMSVQLRANKANGNFGPFEATKRPAQGAVAERAAKRRGRPLSKRRLNSSE